MSNLYNKYLLILVRAARVLAGTGLIVGFVPIFFIFPMLFDSPNTSLLLVLGVLATFPLSFALTSNPYRNLFAQGKMVKALLYGTAPLLLIGGYAGILAGMYWLDSIHRYPSDAVVATVVDESKLFVKVPEKCSPDVYGTKYTMHGTWRFSQDNVDFICSLNFSDNKDSFFISEALSKPTVENEIFGNLQLIKKDGDTEIFRSGAKNGTVLEIVAFTAEDGYRVFVRYPTPPQNFQYFRVSRRLDNRFELTYGISQPAGDIAQLVEIDRQVVSYARSITHRIK
jgi:hypothetical protein